MLTVLSEEKSNEYQNEFCSDIDIAHAILTSEEYLHFVSETDFGQAWTVEKGGYVERKNLYRLYIHILNVRD